MEMFVLIAVITAAGGALLLWHAASRTKQISEGMLRHYAEMLAEARAERGRRPVIEAEDITTDETTDR